jgi:hypothetical protein
MTYLAVPGRVVSAASRRTLLVQVYSDCDHFPQWEVKLKAYSGTTLEVDEDQLARVLWSVGLEQMRAEIARGGDPPDEIDVDQAEIDRRLRVGATFPAVGEVSWSVAREWIRLRSEKDYLEWRKWFYGNTPAGTRIHLGPPDTYPCRATVVEGGPFGHNRISTAVYAPG